MANTKKTNKKKKQKPGPKQWMPNKEEIEKLSILVGSGVTLASAAKAIGVHYNTLNERCKTNPEIKEAIKAGKSKKECEAVGLLWQHIKNGNVPCLIFYMKCQLGWKEDPDNRLDEEDVNLTFDFS